MTEQGLTKNQIIAELVRSPHAKGKDIERLNAYLPTVQAAAKSEPDFLAHLIAWNERKGQVRDSKVALPVASLSVREFAAEAEFRENSLAHLALLGPRGMLKAVQFAWKTLGRSRLEKTKIRETVELYLRSIEEPWKKFDCTAILHRHTLKSLYAMLHIKPSTRADNVVMKGENPCGSIFEVVANLGAKIASEAALDIVKYRIPFLIAQGALGKRLKDEPELVLALIEKMSGDELITNTKSGINLVKLGVQTNPVLRAAYEKALEAKVTAPSPKRKKGSVLKTGVAAKALEESGHVELAAKLHGAQDKQIAAMGVEGNWLVLGDRSPSMERSVDLAKQVAGTLAAMVKGKVWLVFFDSTPQAIDCTGASLDVIDKATRHIRAGGSGTSIGCGLQRMLDEKQEFDGIAIVSDGEENSTPYFTDAYARYAKFVDKAVPVYFYHTDGGTDNLTRRVAAASIDMQSFDMTHGVVDYYSLPNVVATMRTNRYSLIDEIMATRLLTVNEVLKLERKEVEEDVLTAT